MVLIEKEKLIIEIETQWPAEDLYNLQCSLLNLLSCMSEDHVCLDNIYYVTEFLKKIQPSASQLRMLTKGEKDESMESDQNNNEN